MEKIYPLYTAPALDFSSSIARHSGDETIAYTKVFGEDILLSYYYPVSVVLEYAPAIVLIHGGGWSNHKVFEDQHNMWQGDYLGYLARYYADKGYVSICVDYRLSREEGQAPDYQLIDCYNDCTMAMDYILLHASEHHIDTNRISILGESAGGHLAGMLATMYRNNGFCFQRAFLVNSILDFESCPIWKSHVPKKTTNAILENLSFQERARYLSPITHINKDLCPVVLLHGLEDNTVGHFHSENFYHKMQEMALTCDLHLLEGTTHAFLLAEYTKNMMANQIGVSILNTYLLN